jgi:hypothetical protein
MQLNGHVHVRALALKWALAAAIAALILAAPARASMVTFGPNLATGPAPTLDTANGAAAAYDDEPLSLWNTTQKAGSGNADEAISTAYSVGCVRGYSGEGTYGCTPWFHSGADSTVWNTSAISAAPQGGQALEVDLKGCTVEDTSTGNTQASPNGQGGFEASNSIQFQTLTPQAGGAYEADATAGIFQLPWCSDSANPADPSAATNTSTITPFHPLHMCISAGDTVSFYDLGGTVYPNRGPAFYPQGAPFDVIAQMAHAGTDSFADADVAGGVYTPGSRPRGDNSGWGLEPGQEVMLSVIEGSGDDAYGLCPGGNAVEPSNSNTVICLTHHTNPGDPYGTCNAQNQPVFAPVSSLPPTISGTAQQRDTLTETHGAWTNSPYGYSRQWEQCDGAGSGCQPISGATGSSYRLAAADVGHTIVAQESATNDANTDGPASSAPTAVVTTTSGADGSGSTKLTISKLRLTSYAFVASQGTTTSYQDSLTGFTTLKVSWPARGKLKRGSCVAPTTKLRHARNCTRTAVLETLTHHDSAGVNTVPFLDEHLAKGFYTLNLTTTLSGQQTATDSLTFRVISPPRKH